MILNHFQKQCVSLAVLCSTSALDENSIRTTARTKAKHFMKNKADEYAMHNYANVGTHGAFIDMIWDNGCLFRRPWPQISGRDARNVQIHELDQ